MKLIQKYKKNYMVNKGDLKYFLWIENYNIINLNTQLRNE